MKTGISLVFSIAVALVVLGCVKANVELGSQRTALENQILGSYKDIQEDVWMVASVRGAEPGKKIDMSEEKRAALEAMNNRKFNKDDIDEFKAAGYIGEGNLGLVAILEGTEKKLAEDPQKLKLIQDVLSEENRDREAIMKRVIAVNENLGSTDMQKVQKIFAQMNRDNEINGNFIQLENGQWVKKE